MYRLNDLEFDLIVIIKRANKRIYIRVKDSNLVEITTPVRLSDEQINEYLKGSYSFIKKRFIALANKSIENSKNTIHYLGKEYKLEIKEGSRNLIEAKADIIYIEAKKLDEHYIKELIYKNLYFEAIKLLVQENLKIAKAKLNITFPVNVSCKDVKTYYGKCYFKENRIVLAYSLAKYEPKYIISVIYHELAHFYYHDHQAGFYNLLEGVFPGYKKVQHNLRMTKYNDIY